MKTAPLCNPFDMGVVRVDKREWFHSMAHLCKAWTNVVSINIRIHLYLLDSKYRMGRGALE